MKITRIDGKCDAGIWDEWRAARSAERFAAVNVIYGGTGSGKSTLARLFGGLQRGEESDAIVTIDVMEEGKETRRISSRKDLFWSALRVFDSGFVDSNLFFDVDGRSDTKPLLVLGQRNVGREQRRAEINKYLEEFEKEYSKLKKEAEAEAKEGKALATNTARTIAQELQPVGGRYAARRYTAPRLLEILSTVDEETDSAPDEEIARSLSIVQGKRLPGLKPVAPTVFDLEALEGLARDVLQTTVTSLALSELVGNVDREVWVEKGLVLHQGIETCLFCANEIGEERLRSLDGHFDKSFKNLKAAVTDLKRQILEKTDAVAELLEAAPDPVLLYDDLENEYKETLDKLAASKVLFSRRAADLCALLEDKLASPFEPIQLGELRGLSQLDFNPLNREIRRHNERSAEYDTAVKEAAVRIERARAAAIANQYNEKIEAAARLQKEAGVLWAEIQGLQDERNGLRSTALDPGPLAEELTTNLAALIGRDELAFVHTESGYTIQRKGEPATALSQGEKTAISLLYFLSSLRAENSRGVRLTVVIDDPVSSLDQEFLMGASAFLWSALIHNDAIRQVILLTHSFELFRLWGNQLDRLPRKGNGSVNHSIYELRARYELGVDGDSQRRPELLLWGDWKLRKKLYSQYHYLFWRVASVLSEAARVSRLETELEATSVLPNAARQMLEAFLAFKYPDSIGDFRLSMKKAFEDGLVSDVLRQRVTRFLHGSSHNEQADIGRPAGVGEGVTALRSAFEFMAEVDAKHFRRMCSALDLEPSNLLRPGISLGRKPTG